MKLLLLIILFLPNLLFAQGFGNQSGTCTTCTVIAGRTIDLDNSNVKELVSGNSVANSYDTGQYYVTATSTISNASVPVGFHWIFLGGRNTCSDVRGSTCRFNIGYGTGTQDDTATVVGGDVHCGSLAAANHVFGFNESEFYCRHIVPAGNYPFIKAVGASSGVVTTYYYLEEAN